MVMVYFDYSVDNRPQITDSTGRATLIVRQQLYHNNDYTDVWVDIPAGSVVTRPVGQYYAFVGIYVE